LSRAGSSSAGNSGRVMFEIESPEYRTLDITSSELVREWRDLIGPVTGAETLNYRAEIGRQGDPIDIELRGNDLDRLQVLSGRIKAHLQQYPEVFDVSDSHSNGKQ